MLFPAVHPFPVQLGMNLTRMLTELRQEESALGAANHTTMALDNDMKRGHKHEKKVKEMKKVRGEEAKEEGTSATDEQTSSKYVKKE